MGSAKVDPVSPPTALPRPAFATIFEQEFDYVWFTLKRFAVSERDLEDVTHDVFIRVYGHLDEYDPDRPLRPWLFGFAYRTASEYRRRAYHRAETFEDRVEAADPSPSVADDLVTRETLRLVWRALNEIDLDRRAVFVLHVIDGCPIPEVSHALGIPLNTAYSRLRLAREQFAKTLNLLRLRKGES